MHRHLDEAKLFLVSTLLLFFELALIRFLGSEIPAVGFFKNLILIAAFFGMGLGLVSTIPVRLSFILFAATSLLPHILIAVVGAAGLDQLAFAGFQDDAVLLQKSHVTQGIALVAASFLSAMIPLIFLGRLLGHYFEAVGKPLRAYGWNLVGSLVGTLLFSLICRASMSPIVWFSICAAIFCMVLFLEWNSLGPKLALALAGIVLVVIPLRGARETTEEYWTPYYKVRLEPLEYKSGKFTGYRLNVNNTWFQRSFDVNFLGSPEELEEEAHAARNLRFVAPFEVVAPKSVLVLGSGLGNDTAAGLAAGATSVTAVDIDPLIVSLSEDYHPNQPYQDNRVTLVVDDARHFVSTTEEEFDLILFGVLEARSLFSQFGNLRLDNYVYTTEALAQASELLSPDGVLWLNIWSPKPWVLLKFSGMMRSTFGEDFAALHAPKSGHYAYVAGPGLSRAAIEEAAVRVAGVEISEKARFADSDLTIPTDDWPYVFYRTRELPFTYLALLATLSIASLGAFQLVYRRRLHVQWEFFLLGAAFLLVETSAVVRLALVAGTTWVVNAAVFSGVLVFVFLANWYVSKRRSRNTTVAFVGLFVSLGVIYVFPFKSLLVLDNKVAIPIAAALLSIPVLFSGVVFSELLRKSANPAGALGSNVLGAVVGGFSEYLSMLLGNRAMSLVALLFYVGAFMVIRYRAKS